MKRALILVAMLVGTVARGQESVHVTNMSFTGFSGFGVGQGHGILRIDGRFILPVMEFDFKFSGCHYFEANKGDSAYVADSKSAGGVRILVPAGGEGRMDGCTLKTSNVHVIPLQQVQR